MMMLVTCGVLASLVACGGGAANTGSTGPSPVPSAEESSTPSPSATPTATAAPSTSASATAPSDPDMSMEFISAMTDSTTLMVKGINLVAGGVAGATTCDKAAADLSKLASEPASRKIEATFAAEYAKLDPAIQQVMAPNLVAARAKLKSALGTPQTTPPDGGAPNPCANNKKLQSAMDAFRALMAIGLQTAH
jgi:hypothetical protein